MAIKLTKKQVASGLIQENKQILAMVLPKLMDIVSYNQGWIVHDLEVVIENHNKLEKFINEQ